MNRIRRVTTKTQLKAPLILRRIDKQETVDRRKDRQVNRRKGIDLLRRSIEEERNKIELRKQEDFAEVN